MAVILVHGHPVIICFLPFALDHFRDGQHAANAGMILADHGLKRALYRHSARLLPQADLYAR